MINIPLPFFAMWLIMLAGVITNMLYYIQKINRETHEDISWSNIKSKFLRKEWPSYGISFIFTGIIAYSFVFMKRFDNPNNEEISRWAKWIPLAVLVLYFIGVANQGIFYYFLGRIKNKGQINIGVLTDENKTK